MKLQSSEVEGVDERQKSGIEMAKNGSCYLDLLCIIIRGVKGNGEQKEGNKKKRRSSEHEIRYGG